MRGVAASLGLRWPALPDSHQRVLLHSDWYFHTQEDLFLDAMQRIPALEQRPVDEISPGDVALFGFPLQPAAHAGIVSGHQDDQSLQVIHAVYRQQVREEPLAPRWQRLLRAVFRVRPEALPHE